MSTTRSTLSQRAALAACLAVFLVLISFRSIDGKEYIVGSTRATFSAKLRVPSGCRKVPVSVAALKGAPNRRAMLSIGGGTILAGLGEIVLARPTIAKPLPEGYDLYKNEDDGYSIGVPKGWQIGKNELSNGELGTSQTYRRRITGILPPNTSADDKTNINVVVSAVAPDFKNMGSFGAPESFGLKLVNLVDRKFGKNINKNVNTARLLDTFSRGDIYFAEYETKEDYNEEIGDYKTKLHFYVANVIRNTGMNNKMYSVTGVCRKGDMEKYYDKIVESVQSFQPPENT